MPGVSTATIRPHDRVQGASVNAHHGKTGPPELSKTRVSKSGDGGQKREETHNGKVATSDAAVIPGVKVSGVVFMVFSSDLTVFHSIQVTHENIRNREPTVYSKASPQSQSESLYSAQVSLFHLRADVSVQIFSLLFPLLSFNISHELIIILPGKRRREHARA
jgi:hypothetical protein